ncbi:MAG: DNA-nicking Smr family endonuclease [Alphaproteobacteria bacterium]|jgi:DNA-nicking Smr family endonuclease
MSNNNSDKDLSFWHAYTKSVKPIYRIKALQVASLDNGKDASKASLEPKMNRLLEKAKPAPSLVPENIMPMVKQQQTFRIDFTAEKNAKKRMKKGKFIYDAKIDLHGFTQIQAFDALKEFVTYYHHKNMRHLLVVTGRGRYCYQTLSSSGVLIKKVPEWLKSPPLAAMVSVIEQASIYDGGEGALYVVLGKR